AAGRPTGRSATDRYASPAGGRAGFAGSAAGAGLGVGLGSEWTGPFGPPTSMNGAPPPTNGSASSSAIVAGPPFGDSGLPAVMIRNIRPIVRRPVRGCVRPAAVTRPAAAVPSVSAPGPALVQHLRRLPRLRTAATLPIPPGIPPAPVPRAVTRHGPPPRTRPRRPRLSPRPPSPPRT